MSQTRAQTPEGDVYEVFAKFQADEPLHHVGSVIAANRELARAYAFTLYNEWAWNEMIVAPRQDVIVLVAAV
jgi:1,2-phenylacetyl-CoA epoxidase PaaB subunit